MRRPYPMKAPASISVDNPAVSSPIVTVTAVSKTYASGLQALKRIDLTIRRGEILALLGPNGAGKTTLINIICGIVTPSAGSVVADGHDIVHDYRAARRKIGLVPQELHTDAFENVWATVRFSRGLFGKAPDPAYCEKVLRDLSLRSEEHTSELQSQSNLVCRLLLEKKKNKDNKLSSQPTAVLFFFFFFNDTATTEIYTLSLHDALPISARRKIGLVPQELHTDAFENVWATVRFSRGLFGKAPDPAYCEKVLRDLSLWDKKDSKILTLSGGMKRGVMIAKALSHEPQIRFLDEPTAGVDVELRRDMWQMVRRLRESGVTIILTTHYIEEAEEMADRIGVINKGELIVVEDKSLLMRKLGKKQLTLQLQNRLAQIPPGLSAYPLELADDGHALVFTLDAQSNETGIATLLKRLGELDINFKDLHSSESSLEEIFVNLVRTRT